ncbi:hypothetical protein [Longimicrobium sp.]|uniref:hypothetical protein n=1 Tax=Longimicrobium sp. TaxID=2029185 RepID=UPI002E34AAAD|nr:hypothetical protein [Longimicrobium sp.]HEX6041387.1 hypothetical protein [Longimicrobium sp.]
MNEPQPLPLWFIPLFPLLFAGMWLGICALLASIGGWHGLGARFREPPNAPRPTARAFWTTSLRMSAGLPVDYRSCVILRLGDAGIHLRTWILFRFLHPPLLIPWAEVESCTPGRHFLRRAVMVRLRGTDTSIRIYGGPGAAVEEGWRRYQAWAARSGAA